MRPSLAVERQVEMLEALAQCVAELGIEQLTVQAIADRSGWSRGHVRHYLGNKSDQLLALVDLLAGRYANSLEEIVNEAPLGTRRRAVYGELFGDVWQGSRFEDSAVLDALTAYAAANPHSGISLTPMYLRILAVIELALGERYDAAESKARAESVLALAYGLASMLSLKVFGPEGCSTHAAELMGLEYSVC